MGSSAAHLNSPDEGGLMMVVIEDQAIVQPGETPDGLAIGKGVVLEQPVSVPASAVVAPVVPTPLISSNAPTVKPSVVAQAKVENQGLAPAVFVPPAFLIRKEPVYPERTRRAGIEGRVVLKIFLSATGAIRSTEVVVSSGNQSLDQSAIQAVRASKFSPAQCDRVPVESHATASYRFELR